MSESRLTMRLARSAVVGKAARSVFTREGSLVRSQLRPLREVQLRRGFAWPIGDDESPFADRDNVS